MKLLDKWVPKRFRMPLLVLIAFHALSYGLPKLLAASSVHHIMGTQIDQKVPFLSWTVIVYVGAYLYWVINALLAANEEEERAVRFFTADLICKIITGILFVAFPTTIIRPELGSGIWDKLLGVIYAVDTPDNLFPSMHCSFSWICYRAVARDRRIPLWYRGWSLLFTFLIFVSTMTTRQHVLADVLGGWFLAELCWQLAGLRSVSNGYRRLLRLEVGR